MREATTDRSIRTCRGFTYVELGAVVGIMMLVAAAVVPSIVRMERGRNLRAFQMELVALASEARSQARQSGDTVALSFDKSTREFVLVEESAKDGVQQLRSLALPPDINTAKFSADKDESPPDGFRLPFFPDGTSSGGGVEFTRDGKSFSLSVGRYDGRPRITEGALEDMGLGRWKAGDYASRG
jgi:general secretion pathway protein H